MTETVADIVAELAQHDRDSTEKRSAIMDRLRAAVGAPNPFPEQAGMPTDLIRACDAEYLFGVTRSFLYKRALKQLGSPFGFAFRTEDGDIQYSRSRLKADLDEHPPQRSAERKKRSGNKLDTKNPD